MKSWCPVAVIGGGIFGTTTAIRLARNGYLVELYEKNSDILTATSGINQYRLHSGYHYPRSLETAISCRDDEKSFRSEYAGAILDHFDHFYAISRWDSLVSATQYLNFLDEIELEYKVEIPDFLHHTSLDACIRVKESLFDLTVLRALVWRKLHENGVIVHLNREALPSDVSSRDFEFVVVATYATVNAFLAEEVPSALQSYQFEVCEKPVLRLPPHLANKSAVIMDGPFMCIDPMGTTGLSVMGHVVHGVHHRNVGLVPLVPGHLRPYLNNGIIPNPEATRVPFFFDDASRYFRGIDDAEHVGSMYTVRTVLPETDKTDARPTLVKRVSNRVITLLSGKIGTCVHAANQVVDLLSMV